MSGRMSSKVINLPRLNIFVALFFFLFVFFTPLDYSLNKYGGTYVPRPDTPSYFNLPLDPWESVRTPGYPLFLYPFLEPHREKVESAFKNASQLPQAEIFPAFPKFINAQGLQEVFDNIVLCQRVVLALGAAFLVYTCSLYINALVVGVCFFLGVKLCPLVNPAYLLTESVAQPLSFFAIGLLLLFFKKGNFIFLFLATLCASSLYLVRPAGIYMLALSSFCWLYFFWKDRFHHIFKFLIVATGFLPALAYIAYLSITSGYLMFGTHPEGSDLQFSSYYLQKEDIENMPTLRAREYARIYLDKVEDWKKEHAKRVLGPDFEQWPRTRSFGYRYNTAVWALMWLPAGQVLAELAKNPQIGPLGIKDLVIMGRELKSGVLKRHTGDRIKTVGCNILAGLGYYRDYRSSSLWKYGFPLIMGSWGVWGLALLFCPRVRFCLFLPGAAHFLHIFAISYGNFIHWRYINLTEPLFLFAVFLSLWALAGRLGQFCRKVCGNRARQAAAASG